MADDHNDQAGVLWNARAPLVAPWPPSLLRFGGRLAKHVVNVWQQVMLRSDPHHCTGPYFPILTRFPSPCNLLSGPGR